MRFLIIEDDDYKAEKVAACLEGHEIVRTRSYNTGVRALIQGGFDGVILDMGLPVFDDGYGLKPDQGILVLMEMRRKGIDIPVLVHSGNKFDVSEFNNVKDYIVADQFDISKRVVKFVATAGKRTN